MLAVNQIKIRNPAKQTKTLQILHQLFVEL